MPRPLKPSSVLKLEKGKLYDEQRDRDKLEPKAKEEIKPRCPKRFSKEERKEWRYFKKILENYGLFTIANAPHMEMLATAMKQYKDCSSRVAETGLIIKGPKGNPMYNPYWNACNKLEDKIHRCLDALGLSSVGLAKIGSLRLKAQKQKSEMEGLLD